MLFVGVYKDLLFMKAYQGVVLVVSEENRSFFANLLPNAKLSAISTHSGHWSPLIGFLKARCWRQRNCCMFFGIFQFQVSTHTSTASLAARAAFSGGKKRGNTRGGIRLRHPKNFGKQLVSMTQPLGSSMMVALQPGSINS